MTVDWLLVLAGALVGAPLRYWLGVDAHFRLHSTFPWGTLAANLGAALILGFIAEGSTDGDLGTRVKLLIATGFCGALSTWSTFSYELLTLTSARRVTLAGGYLLLTVGLGVGMSFAGAAVARAAF
ncbi:fluoride efflux transporter FluC [Streptomyces sp. DT24]|uniref:fluoride efflux transporter FluC n=1 Tax=unclassified Streptomyces TaxID=2593676 RepID=UPI0023B9C834|nr:CrcB family protein [Streptomyces sp. AM 4-1-1]WEH36936.1 CrcB family protein [Streptomyces sp. AM 4-1-1]